MRVVVSDRAGVDDKAIRALASLLEAAGKQLDIPDRFEMGLVLANQEDVRDLNRKYLGRQGNTDVLAFPLIESWELESIHQQGGEEDLLGDVVICVEVARSQSEALGLRFEDELAALAIHGLLHLLGYTHQDEGEAEEMRVVEEKLLGL